MKTAMGFIGTVLSWIVILGAAAVILLAVVVPRIAGATPYTVLTSSMEPTLPPGTLIVVRPVDPDSLVVGDVVTVQLESGESQTVTHRIVEIGYDLTGIPSFVTQGDANPDPDSETRQAEQIRGKLWYSIPLLGYPSTYLTGQDRQWFVYVVVAGLGAYAVWMFVSSRRDKKKDAAAKDAAAEDAASEGTTTESPYVVSEPAPTADAAHAADSASAHSTSEVSPVHPPVLQKSRRELRNASQLGSIPESRETIQEDEPEPRPARRGRFGAHADTE